MNHVSSALLMKLKVHAVAVCLVAGGVSGTTYYGPRVVSSQKLEPSSVVSISKPQPATQKVTILPHSEPTGLRISKIGVNAPLIRLSLKADGSLETPNSATQVGWYKNSPTPGELGPSVMVGHVDYVHIGAAVFWHLHELQPGDIVEVDRADGTIAKFKIDTVKQFSQQQFPTQEVYGNINYAGIRLITCGGTFNSQTRHYSDNTVVFGSLIGQ